MVEDSLQGMDPQAKTAEDLLWKQTPYVSTLNGKWRGSDCCVRLMQAVMRLDVFLFFVFGITVTSVL